MFQQQTVYLIWKNICLSDLQHFGTGGSTQISLLSFISNEKANELSWARPQNRFLGRAKDFLDWAKTDLTLYICKIYSKTLFCTKNFPKCHWCGRSWGYMDFLGNNEKISWTFTYHLYFNNHKITKTTRSQHLVGEVVRPCVSWSALALLQREGFVHKQSNFPWWEEGSRKFDPISPIPRRESNSRLLYYVTWVRGIVLDVVYNCDFYTPFSSLT